MKEEDLDWVHQRPALVDPQEAVKAQRIIKREHSVPRGKDNLASLRPLYTEEYAPPPSSLDPQRAWVFPALAYCMVGVDKSLFEIYSWALDAAIDVVSYQTEVPIAAFDGADVSRNRWFYTVQGVAPENLKELISYIETYQFNDIPRQLVWRLVAFTTRVADPFVLQNKKEKHGVNVTLLLPECLTTKRCVVITREPGLRLEELRLGMSRSPEVLHAP